MEGSLAEAVRPCGDLEDAYRNGALHDCRATAPDSLARWQIRAGCPTVS